MGNKTQNEIDIFDRIGTYERFFDSTEPCLTCRVAIGNENIRKALSAVDLQQYDFHKTADIKKYVDYRLYVMNEFMKAPKADIDDDDVYCIQNLIGVGAIGAAFADTNVVFKGDTSYCDPLIHDYDTDIDKVGFSPDNPWYRAQMNILEELIRRWDGTYTIQPLSLFDAFDLANQLRGNDIFLDVYENPDGLQHLMAQCEKSILEMYQDMLQYLRNYPVSGSVHAGLWFPGGGYLSCDIADMVSCETFMNYNYECLGRLAKAIGGVLLHHHELGFHQLKNIASVDGVCIQEMNRDPNTRHLPELINEEVHEISMKTPLTFPCVYEDVVKHIDKFKEGKYAIGVKCDNYQQARELLSLVSQYRC